MNSSTQYWNYITQQSPTFFPLKSSNIKLEQNLSSSTTQTIYNGTLEKLIHNDNVSGAYDLSSATTMISSKSGNISCRFLQDYSNFNLTNNNNYIILDIPTLILPNTDASSVIWSNFKVYTSESIQMVAMGTNIIRDVSYGFPTAVNVVLYITPKINAIVSDNKYNTYVADTLDIISEAPNQLPTTSIPFTKKYVKSYPITYSSNTSTNTYNVNVYDIISHVNQFRPIGQCINNINTWIYAPASYTK